MRDPLSWIPVRYKLPLTFAFLCLVAFGLGGYVVTTTARQSLSTQIQLRLNERATALNLVVDKSLELLGRRVEDFASDGFIRLEFERLAAGGALRGSELTSAREELTRHLRENKLPLVSEFVDAHLLNSSGVTVLSVHADPALPASFDDKGLWVGPLTGPGPEYPYPTFLISTVLHSIQGNEHLGFLQIVVRADTWAKRFQAAMSFPGAEGFTARLSSPGGHSLVLASGSESAPASGASAREDRLEFVSTIARTGWNLDLAVDSGILTIPINELVGKFLYVGLALVVLTVCLLLFPRQFLLKPLSNLQDAVRRIAEGDFKARVETSSKDEVGDLGRGFNFMATAIEERTRILQQTAEALERREGDIRFERDRLNTVIRSMEDGLFILDSSGQVTLSNVAARPVIESLALANSRKTRLQCRQGTTSGLDCLHCISDFSNEVQGCVVAVGAKIYEINGAVLTGPRAAAAGKVFVSRDVTVRFRQAEKEAQQERLSVLGEIAAVMAHELNNPLAAISMFAQMLKKGLESNPDLRSHADVIHRNTESCKTTIRSLLDMATTSTSEFDEFDMHQLVVEVAQLLEPVAQRAGLSIRVGERAKQTTAFGDEIQLRQAAVNLVMNAIQAFPSGERGEITVETVDRGDEVGFVVRDNGPGIPQEIQEHIFEPFFTTKPPGDGTGLGLSTSRRIVEAQRGRLSLVKTGPGCSVFQIVLPRRRRPRSTPSEGMREPEVVPIRARSSEDLEKS